MIGLITFFNELPAPAVQVEQSIVPLELFLPEVWNGRTDYDFF